MHVADEVRFHDPSEFSQEWNQQEVHPPVGEKHPHEVQYPHESHDAHGDHKHGMGESIDKE